MAIDRKNLKLLSASLTEPLSADMLVGSWQNELGSVMAIETFDGRNFTGTYKTAVSAGGGSVTGVLAGTVAGDAIAFTVNWSGAFSSVTAWSGLLLGTADSPVVYTLWHLAATPEEDSEYWLAINAGADLFVPRVD